MIGFLDPIYASPQLQGGSAMDRETKLIIEKVHEIQDMSITIAVVSRLIDEMSRNDHFSEYQVFGLNGAIKLLADYQSKTIEFVEELLKGAETSR